MIVEFVTPILNVSDIASRIAWFDNREMHLRHSEGHVFRVSSEVKHSA